MVSDLKFDIEKQRKKENAQRQQKIEQARQKLKQDIEQAGKRTGDPCSQATPIEIVLIPQELGGGQTFILMGQEIYIEKGGNPSEQMWQAGYQLIPKKDRVELWRTQWRGGEIPPIGLDVTREKLGEKFAPGHPICK